MHALTHTLFLPAWPVIHHRCSAQPRPPAWHISQGVLKFFPCAGCGCSGDQAQVQRPCTLVDLGTVSADLATVVLWLRAHGVPSMKTSVPIPPVTHRLRCTTRARVTRGPHSTDSCSRTQQTPARSGSAVHRTRRHATARLHWWRILATFQWPMPRVVTSALARTMRLRTTRAPTRTSARPPSACRSRFRVALPCLRRLHPRPRRSVWTNPQRSSPMSFNGNAQTPHPPPLHTHTHARAIIIATFNAPLLSRNETLLLMSA
jgi:hypothetical protein